MWDILFISLGASISGVSGSSQREAAYVSPYHFNRHPLLDLFKRQGCPGGYSNCDSVGDTEACCPTDQICDEDAQGNVACCPIGAACTGTVGEGNDDNAEAPNTDAVLVGDGSDPTITSGFMFPTPTEDNDGENLVPGAAFPFAIVPTSFQNAAECSSYATSCSERYEDCLQTLGGDINPVTVAGGGMGTVVGGAPTPVEDASSVCTSISSAACFGLQPNICPQYGGDGGDSGNEENEFVAGSMPRVTPCPELLYAAGAGLIAGAVGGVL